MNEGVEGDNRQTRKKIRKGLAFFLDSVGWAIEGITGISMKAGEINKQRGITVRASRIRYTKRERKRSKREPSGSGM